MKGHIALVAATLTLIRIGSVTLVFLLASRVALASQLDVISEPLIGGATGNSHSVSPDIDDSGDVPALVSGSLTMVQQIMPA